MDLTARTIAARVFSSFVVSHVDVSYLSEYLLRNGRRS